MQESLTNEELTSFGLTAWFKVRGGGFIIPDVGLDCLGITSMFHSGVHTQMLGLMIKNGNKRTKK